MLVLQKEGFMKQAAEIDSSAIICIPSFIKNG
jgi:hypothetical protein